MEIIVAISADRPAKDSLCELEIVHRAMRQYAEGVRVSREQERLLAEGNPVLAAKLFSEDNMNSYAIEVETLNRLCEKFTGPLHDNASTLSINPDGIIQT